jgi:PAS domain S-box-containing protein
MVMGVDLARMSADATRTELAMLRAAARQSRTGAWRYDASDGAVFWSDLTSELFGFPPGETVDAETAIEMFEAPGRNALRAAFEACMSEGTPYDLTLRFRDRSGRARWSRAMGAALRDDDGRIVGAQGAFSDITAEVEAKAAAARSERSLSEILGSLSDGFFILDDGWRFSFVNDAAEALLQSPRGTLLGANVWERFPEAVGSRFERVYREVARTGRSAAFVEYFPPLESWFEVSAHATAGGLAVYFRRINDQLREQERLRLLSAAVAHEAEAVLILELSSDSADGPVVVFANPAAERLSGRAEAALLDAGLETLAGPDGGRALASATDEAASSGVAVEGEAEIRGAEGRPRLFEFSVAPVPDDSGRVGHVAVVGRDVTEARQVEAQVRRKERLSLLGQLSGGVSHDFNNLLAVILGNLELMESEVDPAEREMLRREAIDAVLRGKELNDSLLAFAGRAPIRPSEVDVAALVRGMSGLLRRTLPSNIRLDFALPERAAPVALDRSMMESCVLNLVLNARHALPDGGRIEIAVSERPRGTDGRFPVTLSVRDDGVGVPSAILDRVFDPFVTTRPVGEGSGLGLSRVKGFVEQSGGTVTLDSVEGEGTQVTLTLPSIPGARPSADRTRGPAAGPSATDAPRRLGRALLVEDSAPVAATLRRLLASIGLEVATAATGEEAVAGYVAAEGAFDLLVTDVVMPGMSGHALVRTLRDRDPLLAVIVVSGYPDAAEGLDEEGALTRVLGKPVGRDALLEAAETALEARARRLG